VTKPWLRLSSGTYWLLVKFDSDQGQSRHDYLSQPPIRKLSRVGLIVASPLLISAAQAAEHLDLKLDTAAHYVSAANGTCGPHDLDRVVDAVELHQPTVAPLLKGLSYSLPHTSQIATRHHLKRGQRTTSLAA
jgi:hypothetical protein